MAYWDKQPASKILLNQNLPYLGASVPSTFFSKQTYQIRVCTQIAGYFVIGDATAASTTVATVASGTFIPASTVGGEYFQVTPGQQIAFISTSTSSGIVSIAEMT